MVISNKAPITMMKEQTIAAMIATFGLVAFESYTAAEQKFQGSRVHKFKRNFQGWS